MRRPSREAEVARENPELAALFREGYDPALEPARLEALPDGTLGREYARFIRANQIDPLGNLLALSRPKNLLEYQFWRAYKLHDVLHVVLDCDATALGEVPIVAYSLGQARSTGVRAPAMALCVLLLHMALRRTEQFQPAVRLAAEWMRRGEQTRGYATHRLEDWMDRPVSRGPLARARAGLKRVFGDRSATDGRRADPHPGRDRVRAGPARDLPRRAREAIPAAGEALGLRLRSLWLEPPIEVEGVASRALIDWELDDVAAFWSWRQRGVANPDLAAFWSDAAPQIARRVRRYASSLESAGLEPVAQRRPMPAVRSPFRACADPCACSACGQASETRSAHSSNERSNPPPGARSRAWAATCRARSTAATTRGTSRGHPQRR